MSVKFGKNREVNNRYLNIPVKYILHYDGSNIGGKDKYTVITFDEWKKMMNEWNTKSGLPSHEFTYEGYVAWKKYCDENGYDYHYKKLVKKGKDKTLCIVDFYGSKALVGWRNNNTCKIGMTRLCNLVTKNKKTYIDYKGKLILISDDSGWVF